MQVRDRASNADGAGFWAAESNEDISGRLMGSYMGLLVALPKDIADLIARFGQGSPWLDDMPLADLFDMSEVGCAVLRDPRGSRAPAFLDVPLTRGSGVWTFRASTTMSTRSVNSKAQFLRFGVAMDPVVHCRGVHVHMGFVDTSWCLIIKHRGDDRHLTKPILATDRKGARIPVPIHALAVQRFSHPLFMRVDLRATTIEREEAREAEGDGAPMLIPSLTRTDPTTGSRLDVLGTISFSSDYYDHSATTLVMYKPARIDAADAALYPGIVVAGASFGTEVRLSLESYSRH